jgi:hypothetical protein
MMQYGSALKCRRPVNPIIHGIGTARTDSVVYFLLTAYVEARVHSRRLRLGELVARLPLLSVVHVDDCLHLLRALHANARTPSETVSIGEALEVFPAASDRLKTLEAERKSLFSRPPPASTSVRRRVYGPAHS